MNRLSRRDYLAMVGAGAGVSALGVPEIVSQTNITAPQDSADRARRMKWWHEAKFGMFIHWGLYSVLGRHEWVMENEGIPVAEYEQLTKQFLPKPTPAKDWAKLARKAGMKYMVMTTKHHEGFCLFDSKLTPYCAPKQACGRDLVREFVDAARGEGLRVGFYHSLMDWHHPDGALCATDEAARKRFIEYIRGQIKELLTNYGKIDILWYDVAWPLDAAGWESERMNQMVFSLQPDIIVNNRNKLPGDFSTPEQRIQAEQGDRAWEACMTMNDSWGYNKGDDAWKSPKQVVRNLVTCARDGGNFLFNIGPTGDGSIPKESVQILTKVGEWMDKNWSSIYGAEKCQVRRSNLANFTRKGDTLYAHIHFWPGDTFAIGGLKSKVKSAHMLTSNKKVAFDQDTFRVRFTGLPPSPPDDPVTVLAIECENEPTQDTDFVRKERPREKV